MTNILIVGDSYANFRRFDPGIISVFHDQDVKVSVRSYGFSGFHTGKLATELDRLSGSFDILLLVAGVNDVAQRRGVKAYVRDLARLVKSGKRLAKYVTALEIVHFDEFAELSGPLGRMKHLAYQVLFDPRPGRIVRYREAARKVNVDLISTDDFLPAFRREAFKDGIHLTDQEFGRLGRFVGQKLLAYTDS